MSGEITVDINIYYKNRSFIQLCDLVANNNLICLTGSGVSKRLRNKAGDELPSWFELLTKIKMAIEKSCTASFSATEKADLKKLIRKKASGDELIEASSILHEKDKDTFRSVLKDSVDLKEKSFSATHMELLSLCPRGIITYNYDVGHENALDAINKLGEWEIILPDDKEKMIELIRSGLKKPFLLKAHGSVEKDESMVLTGTFYRELFNRYPHYKAFMQNVFTNYNLLIVGFGLSDPDFDSLLQNLFSVYGSPIQEHVVIRHKKERTPKDTLFRLRYGLNFLYVDEFDDIPILLHECTRHPGDKLNQILEQCISADIDVRDKAHEEVRKLSEVGNACLASILEERILQNIAEETTAGYSENTENSELVYTYGVTASSTKQKRYKQFLIDEVIGKSSFSEPIAHALVHLRDIMDHKTDIPLIEKWLRRFEKQDIFIEDKNNPDPDNRVYKYCDALLSVLKAKAASEKASV